MVIHLHIHNNLQIHLHVQHNHHMDYNMQIMNNI